MTITGYLLEPGELAKQLVAFVNGTKNIDNEGDRYWTQTVRAGLSQIVAGAGTEVLFTNPPNGVSEFMLDFVAWNRDQDQGIVLAAESEWIGVMRNSKSYADEVAADFWKLLCIKSPLKLMIFASDATSYPSKPIIDELKKAFEQYRHHISGEQYVFIDFAPKLARQAFYVTVPVNAGEHVDFVQIPINLQTA